VVRFAFLEALYPFGIDDKKGKQQVEIYLVQHGEAKREEEDPARPLTELGRQETEQVALAASKSGIAVFEISHSGRRRAQETAEIFAEHLKPSNGIREVEGLVPMDDISAAIQLIEKVNAPLMLVGHLPHLSRLGSQLLVGNSEKEIIAFRNSAIVCLQREDEVYSLRWILTPEITSI